MGWRTDKPLYSLTDDEQNKDARGVWEGESLGGIAEDNNRLPSPVVWLLMLTIITAFAITFPLWGQRPTAALYTDYVKLMDSPEVQAIEGDEAKMEYIYANGGIEKYAFQQENHPISMDELKMVAAQIIELQNQGVDLEEYTIIGPHVQLANFEGNWKTDASGNEVRTRKQPWWDKGYTIDIFYVIYFCLAVFIVIKRLPHYSWQPDHSVAH